MPAPIPPAPAMGPRLAARGGSTTNAAHGSVLVGGPPMGSDGGMGQNAGVT